MGEGLEVLLWLGIMAVVALRSATQNKRRSQEKQGGVPDLDSYPDFEDDDLESPVPVRAERTPARRSTEASDRERGEKKGGLLSRWSDLAAELERQMQEQQRAAREAQAEARMEHAPVDDEPERLVVVPGHRVYPARTTERAAALERRREASPARGAGARSSLEARPHAEPVARKRGRSAGGLERLETFSPLKRAIILSEILNEPPGISGVVPAERRLGGLD